MVEVTGNLWDYPADIRVITTNGTVKKNGECVMGRGCASEAKKHHPGIARALGRMLEQHGNHVFQLAQGGGTLFSFPVKHNWFEKADCRLILRSAKELVAVLSNRGMETWSVVLPRPGCGNGQLKWEDVKPVLAPILDDRFHVITFK